MKTVPPTTVAGIERYLSSGLVKGIGPVLAKKLVGRFGAEVLTVIENRVAALQTVDGIGPKRRERIARAWQEATGSRNHALPPQSRRDSHHDALPGARRRPRDTFRPSQPQEARRSHGADGGWARGGVSVLPAEPRGWWGLQVHIPAADAHRSQGRAERALSVRLGKDAQEMLRQSDCALTPRCHTPRLEQSSLLEVP